MVGWQVTGDGIVALARAVPGLRRLALLNCEINNDHLIALASVLTSLHTLQARLPGRTAYCEPEIACYAARVWQTLCSRSSGTSRCWERAC